MFSNMRIGLRLTLGFLALVLMTLLLGVLAWVKVQSLDAEWRTFEQVTLAKRVAASEAAVALGSGVQNFKNFVLRGGEYHRHFADDMQRIESGVALYRQAGNISAEEDGLLTGIGSDVQKYRQAMASLVAMKQGGTGIVELDKSIKGADRPLAASLKQLLVLNDTATRLASQAFSALLDSARMWIVVSCSSWSVSSNSSLPAGRWAGWREVDNVSAAVTPLSE